MSVLLVDREKRDGPPRSETPLKQSIFYIFSGFVLVLTRVDQRILMCRKERTSLGGVLGFDIWAGRVGRGIPAWIRTFFPK